MNKSLKRVLLPTLTLWKIFVYEISPYSTTNCGIRSTHGYRRRCSVVIKRVIRFTENPAELAEELATSSYHRSIGSKWKLTWRKRGLIIYVL